MQTHGDLSHFPKEPFDFERLRQRAEEARLLGQSRITGGATDEKPLDAWSSCGVHVTKMPDDEQGVLRISVGGGIEGVSADYCVFRGDLKKCVKLLQDAMVAMRSRVR